MTKRNSSLKIILNEKNVSPENLMEIHEILKTHPGPKSVILVFTSGSGEITLQSEITVNADDELLARLREKEYVLDCA